jgi:hypothetical protein
MQFHGNTLTPFRAIYVSFEQVRHFKNSYLCDYLIIFKSKQLGTDFFSDKQDDYSDVLPDIIIQNLNQIKHLSRTACGNNTRIIIKTLLMNQRPMI